MLLHTRLIMFLASPFRTRVGKTASSGKQQSSVLDGARAKLKLKSRKPRFECQYCFEHKEAKEFTKGAFIPWNCQPHLTGHNRVCKTCLEAAISAQLDCKALLDVGCPQCGTAWEPEDLRMLAGPKDSKRLREMDRRAQKRIYVPSELPDQGTLDDMLARGARLCPGCLFPFVKMGGCDSILCE